MNRRPMDYAGSWYPETGYQCRRDIEEFWEEPLAQEEPRGRLGIVPHAGWLYSGRIAARVFRQLAGGDDVELVVVLGGHLGRNDPLLAMSEGEWETPFGPFTIDQGFHRLLGQLSDVTHETPTRYRKDNSTELQLPFAKLKFPRARLLPLRVPPGRAALQLGRLLAEYLEGEVAGAVVVASTDLTHYGANYGFESHGRGAEAVRWVREVNDPAFIDAVAGGGGEAVLEVARRCHNACSPGAVAALLELAGAAGSSFVQVDYATSAETGARDRNNFVGYLGGLFA